MGLALGEFQPDRASPSIDQRVDLGCQAATRTTHATGSLGFF